MIHSISNGHALMGFLVIGLLLFSCSKETKSPSGIPDFNPLVSAFTSGVISAESAIRIQLAADLDVNYSSGFVLPAKIFEFSPSINGQAFVIDPRTIEFRPEKKLPSGADFSCKIMLTRLFRDQKEIQDFSFSFRTIPLNIDVVFDGLKAYSKSDLTLNNISGKVISTDRLSLDETESMISAKQDSRSLPLKWLHQEDGKIHQFTVDSVRRTDNRGSVIISWEGADKVAGSKEYIIPGLNEFTLMDHKVVQQPEQHILLTFSDPLKATQDLNGLIHLDNNASLRFNIEGNLVRIYPVIRQKGTVNLFVEPGIKNIVDYKFTENKTLVVSFDPLKPAVRLIGNGVIVPRSEGLLFPFEAVNLKAVDVKIIRIYENNVAQFLQVNTLDGNYEMKRAGRLIVRKTIQLTSERPINYGDWNAFSLDLSSLIDAEPGAIYRVELSFRQKHSLYECPEGKDNEQDQEEDYNGITENDMAYYDSYYYYGWDEYDEDYYYNWQEREDPCSRSYYIYGKTVARNVLASNLGIIAKFGSDRSMLFAVTDLLTTEPVQDVSLTVYNFQQQILASLVTDKNGTASALIENQPFLLIAKKDKQRGYLRVDPGSSLSLSNFDIQGASVNKGLKGFIYGERGVWRPGDTLFLTFILEDKLQKLPPDHPVTLELFNPHGKRVNKFTSLSGINGFYCFRVPTDVDAPTGNWTAKIIAGNHVFHQNLRIETIKPNRLKVILDFGTEELRSGVASLTGKVLSNWLHGAPAAGLKASVSVNFKNISTSFPGFENFVFTDPSRSFTPVEQDVFSGNLDHEGTASFRTSFNVREQSPGKVNAVFTTRVFEKGGDFSMDQYTIPYSPYPSYTGLKSPEGDRYGILVTDTAHVFQIATVDESGKATDRKNLQVKIYKLDWKWWWHSGDENLASYIGSSYYKPVFEKTLSTIDGKTAFSFKVDHPEWGRFFVRVYDPASGHSAGKIVYFDWPGWAGRADRKDPTSATMLTFSSDKNKYSVGETAVLTIPSGMEGRAFLSIENGTRVVDHYWLKTTGRETTFSFTVTKGMTPNVYVNVTLIQPHRQTINDLPVRMYGVIPLIVEDPETHLSPVIRMPDVLKPESVVDITVSETKGREMTYTIALVDEGLLDLTRFKTPDPWQLFYAREALGVNTFDMFDMVLGAYGGRIDGIFSIGGDEELLSGDGQKANRFPPVVRFIGPFHLPAKKSMTHQLLIPNYVGSVKTMVVAGYKGAYGNAEKITPVRKPLMILATLPRVLGPSETVNLPVTVFAMEDHVKKVNLEIGFNEIFTASVTKQTVMFDRIGDNTVDFELKTKETTGIGNVIVTATSGKEKAVYEVELDVRSPNPEVTRFVYGIAEPGQTWESEFELPGMKGTNTGTLEVSSLPPVDFGRRLKFLMGYPHGCVEQITSSVFPQLYLPDVMDVDDKMKNTIHSNVQAAIQKISAMQLSTGGVGYWPGATAANDWGTSYAGHFMLEAKRKGFTVPDHFIRSWTRYQKKLARNWTGNIYQSEWEKIALELAQAYRLYTLALAGEAETGAMNRLREKPSIKNSTRWRLAAAYALTGQTEAALKITGDLTTRVDDYEDPGFTYGSSLRDMAMILEAMVLTGEREKAIPLLREISDLLSSDTWYSTQTTAFGLIAVSAFAQGSKTSKELEYDFSINNEKEQHAAANTPFSVINYDFKQSATGKVKVSNKGDGLLYTRFALHGTPLPGQEKAFSGNLILSVSYQDMQGNAINVSKLEQGTDFISVVTIRNPGTIGYYRDMALTQIFPSGWEIQNIRLFETNFGTFSNAEYQDFRDDRVYTYFHLPREKVEKFAVKLNAAYKGRFYLPGISCEAMYRNDISAFEKGQWVEVVEAGL